MGKIDLKVSVDTLLMGMNDNYSSLQVLLVKRKKSPYVDRWSLPGGFIGIEESAYTTANRALREKTGLTDVYLEQLYTFTDPGRDPQMRVIDIGYIALLSNCPGTRDEDSAWFDVRIEDNMLFFDNADRNIHIKYSLTMKNFKNGVIEIENYDRPVLVSEEQLAFDHAQIIVEALLRLKNKAEYTDIIFNMMPETFTMTDLMKVYEIVLGKKLYRKNFRDKMKSKTVATGITDYSKSTNGLTPSELYKYK